MEQTNFFFLYLSYLVKPPEKLVKGVHQLRRRQFFRQRSKVDDVSVQNAEKMDLSWFLEYSVRRGIISQSIDVPRSKACF